MATRNHKYGLGDMAESCKYCGLEFSAAHFHDLPCTGKYTIVEHQILDDIGARGEFDDRITKYLNGSFGAALSVRPEVRDIGRAYLTA